ncbi:MAG TPA: hypothetical protein VII06_28535 [Chloroflexota bacterium]|jgi:hypothetical protein
MTGVVALRPLGVRPEIALTPAQQHALQILQDYDLGPVRARLLREGAMPAAWVDEALYEFRRYLGLRALEPRPVMMLSRPIDAVWHTCLLFSRLYADLCAQAFGEFVHHDPAMEVDPDRAARWREFAAAYERCYEPPGRLWQMGRPAAP